MAAGINQGCHPLQLLMPSQQSEAAAGALAGVLHSHQGQAGCCHSQTSNLLTLPLLVSAYSQLQLPCSNLEDCCCCLLTFHSPLSPGHCCSLEVLSASFHCLHLKCVLELQHLGLLLMWPCSCYAVAAILAFAAAGHIVILWVCS